jgi:hypothetical protein
MMRGGGDICAENNPREWHSVDKIVQDRGSFRRGIHMMRVLEGRICKSKNFIKVNVMT